MAFTAPQSVRIQSNYEPYRPAKPIPRAIPSRAPAYNCKICGEPFTTAQDYIAHILVKHDPLSETALREIFRYSEQLSDRFIQSVLSPSLLKIIKIKICNQLGGDSSKLKVCVPSLYYHDKIYTDAEIIDYLYDNISGGDMNAEELATFRTELSDLIHATTERLSSLKKKGRVSEQPVPIGGEEAPLQQTYGNAVNLGRHIRYLPRLRDYQLSAMAVIKLKRFGTLEMPTGSGKTITALAAVRELDPRTLTVVVPYKVLIDQWERVLEQAMGSKRMVDMLVGRYDGTVAKAKRPEQLGKPILITTYMSAKDHPEVFDGRAAVIFDEIHHMNGMKTAKGIRPAIRGIKRDLVLGLSATVKEADPDNEAWGWVLSTLPIIFSETLADLHMRGYLSDLNLHFIPADMSHGSRAKYEDYSEKISSIAKALKKYGYHTLSMAAHSPKESVRSMHRSMMILVNKRRQLLTNVPDKKQKAIDIIKENRHRGGILFFTGSQESARDYVAALNSMDIKAELILADTPKSKRMGIIEGLGKRYDVLVSVDTLKEGIDIPEVEVAVAVNIQASKRIVIQSAGRIIRLNPNKPNKVADFYLIAVKRTKDEEAYDKYKESTYGVPIYGV